MKNDSLTLYNEYFSERDFDRLDLFQLLAEKYGIKSALYPGSSVHITPSFVYPITTYVDTDKRAKSFFDDSRVRDFVAKRKVYLEDAKISFFPRDYRTAITEIAEGFDLLISQYAGFVSQHCKRYLRIGGVLLANNSHGDASMASIDEAYKLSAVVMGKNGRYRLTEKNLDSYFVPNRPLDVTKEYLEKTQKGIGYKKSGSMYVFKRVK
jgi:hypothetical protein